MNENNSSLKVGDTVRYSVAITADEESIRFTLKEINGDRCLIELIDEKMFIRPIECVKMTDIVAA